jgi:tetratricopeptide (TPR) repeat protein
MAGLRDPRGDARWRVFISHTVELREFPKTRSYVTEVERAISATGHVIVDMADFPAADQTPAQVCAEKVRGCDVYLGLLGTRYGTPVRDRPHMSYTELEFDAATGAGLDRLMFLLDPDAEGVGIPPSRLIDREFGDRQDAFRRRVQDSGLLTQSFADPATLGRLVERSLRELAETRRRIDSGIQREQIPAEPQVVRSSKFVNPPPAIAPTWFQDRQIETGLLARYVTDPGIRMVSVAGRGGVGKTAMVCRMLKGLEGGRIPDVAGDAAAVTVGGIVYLSRNGVHQVEYPTLVADLLRLPPPGVAQPLQRIYQDPHHTPAEMMLALLEAFPAGEPVVMLLDNLESVMDPERETLTEQSLHEALTAVLTAPAHAVTVVITTRVLPTALLKVEPARQRQLRLEEGLGSPDAETVLRELDGDGRLGLRDAPDELLGGLREHTRGFPRALEAVKAILDGDHTLTPQDLLDHTRHLPQDQVVQVLVSEAYELLDASAQLVMQALSVYPTPVSEVGVDFLLRPVNPTTDAAPVLTRLVRRQLARFQDRHYHLHPIDRDYARSKIPPGSPGDPPAAFTLTGLQARAADYYTRIRTPRESWRTLEDIRPQLAEFELRCNAGDYDTAATVLNDIDFEYLQAWGHYRTVVDLHGRIHGQISNPVLNSDHLANLGACHTTLGNYRQAIDLFTQALTIDRNAGDRGGQASDLNNLATCHTLLGDYRQAVDLFTQALAIARNIGDRRAEGLRLNNLGFCYIKVGHYRQAVDLCTQALTIARDIDKRSDESTALGNLGHCHYRLGHYRQAIDLFTEALRIARATGNRRLESYDLGYLGNCHCDLGEYQQAIDLHTQSLAIARDIGDRHGETLALDYLGRAQLASGDVRRAVTLLEQAVTIADAIADFEPAVKARSWLARSYLQSGDPAAALAAMGARPELSCPPEEPTIRLLEGLALLKLNRADQGMRAFNDAIAAADPLLALADENVAAMQARALALAGLAAATGDPAQATATAEAFARTRSITAAGVAADTRRLLDAITFHDRSGLLADLRTGQDRDGTTRGQSS